MKQTTAFIYKDQKLERLLWMGSVLLVGVLLGIGITYFSVHPRISALMSRADEVESALVNASRRYAGVGLSSENVDVPTQKPSSAPALPESTHQIQNRQTSGSAAAIQSPGGGVVSTGASATAVGEGIGQVSVGSSSVKSEPVAATVDVTRPIAKEAAIAKEAPTPAPLAQQAAALERVGAQGQRQSAAQAKRSIAPTKIPAAAIEQPVSAPKKPTSKSAQPANTVNDASLAVTPNVARATSTQKPTPTQQPTEQTNAEHGAGTAKENVQAPNIADAEIRQAALSDGKPIVRATLAQANILGLDGASVTFRTGLRVQVGGQFPSGERLLSVNPSSRRIETERRIILLKAEDAVN